MTTITDEQLKALRKNFNKHLVSAAGGHWVYQTKQKTKRPMVYFQEGRNRLSISIYNIAWLLEHGLESVPPNHYIDVKCECDRCVNSSHLLPIEVGSKLRGTANYRHKLTTEAVIEIRRSTEKGVELAKKFRVSPSLISLVRSQWAVNWAWLRNEEGK